MEGAVLRLTSKSITGSLSKHLLGATIMVSNRAAFSCCSIMWLAGTHIYHRKTQISKEHNKYYSPYQLPRCQVLHCQFWDTPKLIQSLLLCVPLLFTPNSHYHSSELITYLFTLLQRHEKNVSISISYFNVWMGDTKKYWTPRFQKLGNIQARWIPDPLLKALGHFMLLFS